MAKDKYWNGKEWEVIGSDAEKVSIKDTSNLFTATDVEGALKELFTNADNAQKGIANVVGSPALPSNTLSQLVTHIQNAKNKGATNLTAKGQSSNGTESLDALMSKISNVSTGKKTATGTGTTDGNGTLIVNGLGFRPRNIIVQRLSYRTNTVIYSEDAYVNPSIPINKFAQNGGLDIYNVVTTNSSGFTATLEYFNNVSVTYFASE